MKKNKISITITGNANTGKTRLMMGIANYLRNIGFELELEPLDFINELELNSYFANKENENDTILRESIRTSSKIKIVEQRTKRILA